MGKTTISVDEATLARFNNLRESPNGTLEVSADMFLNDLMDGWEDKGGYWQETADLRELAAKVERVDKSLETVEERTGRIERAVEELGR